MTTVKKYVAIAMTVVMFPFVFPVAVLVCWLTASNVENWLATAWSCSNFYRSCEEVRKF